MVVPLALLLGVAGCGSQTSGGVSSTDGSALYSCATETRAPPYMPGMTETSSGGRFVTTLMTSMPAPPAQGSDDWMIQVADTSGSPVDGLSIVVTPFMPDHGHGTSVQAVVTDQGNGVYSLAPLYLFMEGYWTVTLNFQGGAAGVADSVMFPVCIP